MWNIKSSISALHNAIYLAQTVAFVSVDPTQKMEASHVPERRHILKDGDLHSHHRDNPKPRAKKEINKRYIMHALKKKKSTPFLSGEDNYRRLRMQ